MVLFTTKQRLNRSKRYILIPDEYRRFCLSRRRSRVLVPSVPQNITLSRGFLCPTSFISYKVKKTKPSTLVSPTILFLVWLSITLPKLDIPLENNLGKLFISKNFAAEQKPLKEKDFSRNKKIPISI